MILCVVGAGGKGMILDMDKSVVECEVSHEVMEKVYWSVDD